MSDKHDKSQEYFIGLLLKHKEVLDAWMSGPLDVKHFDIEYHVLIKAIEFTAENGGRLTRRGYRHYLQGFVGDGEKRVIYENAYNRIHAHQIDQDDAIILSSRILERFIVDSVADEIVSFRERREQKGVVPAVKMLSDSISNLLIDNTNDHKIEYKDISDDFEYYYQETLAIKSGQTEPPEILECGIPEIDYTMVTGFAPGTLTLFCGDIAGFKSTMMLNVGMNIWERGHNVLFVPLEMPKHQILCKMISHDTRIDFEYIFHQDRLSDEHIEHIEEIKKGWVERGSRFYTLDTNRRMKVSVIRREIERHLDSFKPRIVIIDYIANLVPDIKRSERNDLEIGDMLKDLRIMGNAMGFAIISAAQIGREGLKRMRKTEDGKVMAFSEDIRGSHEYSADADNIYFLLPRNDQPKRMLDFFVLKARNGRNTFKDGSIKATFDVDPAISLIKSRGEWLNDEVRSTVSKEMQSWEQIDTSAETGWDVEDSDVVESTVKSNVDNSLDSLFDGA